MGVLWDRRGMGSRTPQIPKPLKAQVPAVECRVCMKPAHILPDLGHVPWTLTPNAA
jgi:hypothetical protein